MAQSFSISDQFSPTPAAAGGLAIGTVAVSRMFLWGKITGISGILSGVISRPAPGDWLARTAFASGLIGCGVGMKAANMDVTESMEGHGLLRLLVAGSLVGFGTQLGNGCTSGHGICGLGRLSLRSFVATPVFMAAASATSIFSSTKDRVSRPNEKFDQSSSSSLILGLGTAMATFALAGFAARMPVVSTSKVATFGQELFMGAAFSAGLGISGMTKPSKVVGFLDPIGAWDPSLAFVMGGALAAAMPGFRLVLARKNPALAAAFTLPTAVRPDLPLVAGATVFGVGWGLAGICPGPAMVSLGSGQAEPALFVAAMLAGIRARAWLQGPMVAPLAPVVAAAAAAAVTAAGS